MTSERGEARIAGAPRFERTYRVMTPAWDIGRPQRAFLDLARRGEIRGKVLDVGCGTGEHALMAAAMGLDAAGVDLSPTAVGTAEKKAHERGLPARFLVFDALRMAELGEQFDTVLDCGMFHVLKDEDRPVFADSIRAVLRSGGRYFMMCFSDQMPGGLEVARKISRDEIRAAFSRGLRIDSIEATRLERNTRGPDRNHAWLTKVTRIAMQ